MFSGVMKQLSIISLLLLSRLYTVKSVSYSNLKEYLGGSYGKHK